MKICIYGAGAIGGSIAARLFSAGYDTSVVARGAHLAAIKADGLYCEAPDKRYGGKLKASDKPADLGPQDCVIVAVKAHMLKDIADGLKPLLHDKTSVVYALNGVPWWYFYSIGGAQDGKRLDRLDPGGLHWDQVGAARAIGCTLSYPASMVGPGLVRQIQATNTIALGEPNGTQSERLEAIAQAIAAAGFKVESKSPIREQVWIKHRRLVPTSLLAILASATAGQVASSADLRPIWRAALDELGALAAAYGFDVPLDFDALVKAQSPVPHRPSILQDLEAGRSMEIDAQFVATQDMARAVNVAIPTLDVLIGLAAARARVAGLYSA
jgi:2-dehydropantoate 2-reductase